MRTTKILSLSLPPKLFNEAGTIAKKEGRTRSELFREALRRYIQDAEWRELQSYGYAQSMKLGVKESDVERLVHDYRHSRN